MSRYKFALSSKIKGMIEWQLEHYYDDKRQLGQYKADMVPSPVQGYSLTAGCSHGVSRTTENVAERIATNTYVMQTERSCKAIEKVISRLDDTDKKLIRLVYWEQSYTIVGAGIKVGLGQAAAYSHVNNILSGIALEMGYVSM